MNTKNRLYLCLIASVFAWGGVERLAWSQTSGPVKSQNPKAEKAKLEEPKIVVHPLTAEEKRQQADYEAFEPLMEEARAHTRADPGKLEARAKELGLSGAATELPFVDWAHYAALALSELDPDSPSDAERAERWSKDYESSRNLALDLFQRHESARAETLADNGLCAYRKTKKDMAACQEAAKIRAKAEVPEALELAWPEWILSAASGLAKSVGWPSRWEEAKARLADSGLKDDSIAEIERKVKSLDRWAMKLNPTGDMERFDALAHAREWARQTGWIPGGALPWGGPAGPQAEEPVEPKSESEIPVRADDSKKPLSESSGNQENASSDSGDVETGQSAPKAWRDVEEWGKKEAD